MTRALAAAVLAALVLPAAAAAHASLISTTPANGAVLARSPHAVVVRFDDAVRLGHGTAAVANETGRSILAGRPRAAGRTVTIPLRPGLADGAYSVRWSIVSDDGHHEEGVLAFAVGAGAPAPHAVLGASTPLSAATVVPRALWYAGLLLAGGAAAFGLLGGGLERRRALAPLSQLLFAGFLLAFVGDAGLLHGAASGTRFAVALDVGAVVLLAGGTAAALAPGAPVLLPVAEACGLAVLLVPPFAGHALDGNQPAALAPLADLAHLAAAATWVGGLACLAWVVPRAAADHDERLGAARRFSATAVVAVAVLGASGLGRAVTELDGIGQLWTTSYGRALLVKTAIFLPSIAVGWLNRGRLAAGVLRLRLTVRAELVAIVGIVVAVAFLTQLRPGRDAPAAAAAGPRSGGPPALPPLDAVVSARELGTDAVAVGRTAQTTQVTVLDADGNGEDDLSVTVNGTTATSCGSGCYAAPATAGRRVAVAVGPRRLVFDLPLAAPDATALLARVADDYRAQRTIAYRERLASTPTNAQLTQFLLVAPDRLRYVIRGGPQAVVIGGRRWDRATPTGRWVETPQSPLQVTHPAWYAATNAHLVAPREITFLDRAIPAWFAIHLDANRRLPRQLDMTAASHFMVDRYSSFGSSRSIEPPAAPR